MDKVWSEEQLEILGIDPKYMPKILKPWDIVGKLTAEMAEKTGFAEGTLVCAGAATRCSRCSVAVSLSLARALT